MNMSRWDWFLFALAAFLAVRALVRILLVRRDTLQDEVERERQQQLKAEKAEAAKAAAAQALAEATLEEEAAKAKRKRNAA